MENLNSIKKGLNGTQIKLIGAFLMVFDHIHQCFSITPYEIPMWFTYLGRLVAPIFLFLAAEGMFYTKNRKKHLFRLYIASNLMGIGSFFIQRQFPSDMALMNNIFFTIFVGCWFIYFIDELIANIKVKNIKKVILDIICLIVPFISTFIILSPGAVFLGPVMLTVLPNVMICEGGFLFVGLIIAFYYLRKSKVLCALSLCLVGIISFVSSGDAITVSNLLSNFQWMMIFSSLFILAYNGEKGKGYKNFFYIFYPAHIYILYIIGWYLAK